MTEAREFARQKMLQRIKRAAENDWRAAAEWLRLTFPADYRRPASNTSVEVTNAVQTGIVCDEATLQKLRRLREQIHAQPLPASAEPRKMEATVPAALPAQSNDQEERQEQPKAPEQTCKAEVTKANAGTKNSTVVQNDPVYLRWQSFQKPNFPDPAPE
jgi:hypothetical protein